MRFDYTITLDDLREAAAPTRPDGQPIATRRRGRGNRVAWGVVITLVAALLIYKIQVNRQMTVVASPAAPPPPSLQNLWTTLLPTALPAALLTVFVAGSFHRQVAHGRRCARAQAAGRPLPAATPTARPSAVRLTLYVLLLLAALTVWTVPALAIPWRPTPAAAVGAGFAPWIAALILIVLTASWAARWLPAQQWAKTPALHRPLTVDVSAAGVWTTDGLTDTLHRWPTVTRYRETDHLLVLTLEDARQLILPLRSASDPDGLRSLVQTHVSTGGTFLPRPAAFPVVPIPPGD